MALDVKLRKDNDGKIYFDVDGDTFEVERDARMFAHCEDMVRALQSNNVVLRRCRESLRAAQDRETRQAIDERLEENVSILNGIEWTFEHELEERGRKLRRLTQLVEEHEGDDDEGPAASVEELMKKIKLELGIS